MPAQNRDSGDAARRFGLRCGELIAQEIGARKTRKSSNECRWEGKQIVIKCAQNENDTVSVLTSMLQRLDMVMAAFRTGVGTFDLWTLSAEKYTDLMRVGRVNSEKAAPQGRVSEQEFRKHGSFYKTVTLPRGAFEGSER